MIDPSLNPWTRRCFLTRGSAGIGAAALATLLSDGDADLLPHIAPKAKRVVHLFMNGGPSQVDTFDPKPLLEKYRFMLTAFTADTTEPGAVTIVISGSRPREAMEKDAKRLAGYDGRLSDLGKAESRHLIPWISDSWR